MGTLITWRWRALCVGAATAAMMLACVSGAASASSQASPPFTQCPAIGAAPSCDILLAVNPDQSISVLGDSSVGPYDGSDDTLVGIVNNSSAAIPAITVSGPGSGLAGFDGDGICTYATSGPNGSGFAGDSYCTSQQVSGSDPGDYAGPGTSFTPDPNSQDDVEVDFAGNGLAPGSSTYFSLEGALTAAVVKAREGGLSPRYVALGDSYSSGEGALDSQFESGTVFADPSTGGTTGCHRSTTAWANQVATAEGLSAAEWKFAACSGAVTSDFYLPNSSYENPYGELEAPQKSAVTSGTQLVTFTIGGNDVGFEPILNDCVFDELHQQSSPGCSHKGRTAYATAINGLRELQNGIPIGGVSDKTLADIYVDIADRMAPGGEIVVAGYPRLFGESRKYYGIFKSINYPFVGLGCRVGVAHAGKGAISDPLWVTYTDATWIDSIVDQGDQIIANQVAAANEKLQAAGVTVKVVMAKNVDQQFHGHRLCDSNTPFLNGVILHGDLTKPDQRSFHPNMDGQNAYARAIKATLNL